MSHMEQKHDFISISDYLTSWQISTQGEDPHYPVTHYSTDVIREIVVQGFTVWESDSRERDEGTMPSCIITTTRRVVHKETKDIDHVGRRK